MICPRCHHTASPAYPNCACGCHQFILTIDPEERRHCYYCGRPAKVWRNAVAQCQEGHPGK